MVPGILQSPLATPTQASPEPPRVPIDPDHSMNYELLSTLSISPHEFLQPPKSLHNAALSHAKQYLDPLALSVSQVQEQRLQDVRRKRKRGEADDDGARKVLRLKQLHLQGFGMEQIWEQARRVLDASRQEVERALTQLLPEVAERPTTLEENGSKKQIKMVRFDEDGFEVEHGSDDEGASDAEIHDASDSEDGFENNDLVEKLLVEDRVDGDEGAMGDEEDIERDDTDLDMDMEDGPGEADGDVFKPDKHGLNDGFFSIDDFNRNSDFLEQQDAMGDPDDGIASDEEDIDWDADPMARPLPIEKGRKSTEGGLDDSPESEDDGPTFGNADLNAPFSDSEDSQDLSLEDTTLSNTNDIRYSDFFAPPPLPSKSRPNRRDRPLPKTQPPTSDDIQRTISVVRRDLFEDNDPPSNPSSDTEDHMRDDNPATARLSTHQRAQLRLAAQIRELEAANVAKREWTLAGEARAAERPLNSLLEEDLEFERAGKPVPVITAAVSEDIEALIKRRILAREFDEVVRRRPERLHAGAEGVRRGLGKFELDDTKSKVGLGELYAEEHRRAADPAAYVSAKDAAVAKQHAEISRLWADVAAKLDALSSWHYRPKPPEVQVRVVGDVAAVRMEEARPSGVGGVGAGEGASRLAPQEVFRVGEGKGEGEVVRGGGVVGSGEMTREEKVRRRRREKERGRKREEKGKGGVQGGKKAKERKEVVAELKRGGVRVIGKRGEVRDVEGKAVKRGEGGKGAGGFKL